MIRCLASALIVFSLTSAPVPVEAGNGKKIKRMLEKSVNRAIRKAAPRKRSRARTTRRAAPKASVVAPVNREYRKIQTALNYFGFDAGLADGILGRKSKSAITGYQGFLGLAATGALSEWGQDFLLASYDRAQADPTAAAHIIAASPHGVQGLLIAYRDDPMQAQRAPQVIEPVDAPAASSVAAPVARIAVTPEVNAASDETLIQFCDRVDVASSARGGYSDPDTIEDPWLALGEQFCFARDDAIFAGDDLMARVQGLSEEQIVEQCRGLGPLLAPYVAAVSQKPQDAVIEDVRAYAAQTGIAPAQLVTTARICLAVGYEIDDMDVAIGSALMLTAMGDPLYAELLGHHLCLGLGTPRDSTRAMTWYDPALMALDAGAEPVFDPYNPERVAVIRTATAMIVNPDVAAR